MSAKVRQAIDKIRQHSPEMAIALEVGDEKVLKLSPEVLAKIPAEPNEVFREKLQVVKAGGTINIIGKQINIDQGGIGNTQTNTFGDF